MKLTRTILIIACLSASSYLSGATSGFWVGAISISDIELKIEITFSQNEGVTRAIISIPQQGARNLPLSNVKVQDQSVYFELDAPIGVAKFDGKMSTEDRIEGTFEQGPASGSFHIDRVDESPDFVVEVGESTSIPTDGSTSVGSLTVPSGTESTPVALIVPGSGPTDRDGNTPLMRLFNDSLKLLAQALEQAGIASLRYDKRGVGESSMGTLAQEQLRFHHYVDDAVKWLEYLKTDDRFERVFVIGHSEGALVGSMAAEQSEPDGLILLNGVGRKAGDLLQEQFMEAIPTPSVQNSVIDIIETLEKGETYGPVAGALYSVFGEPNQQYLVSWFKIDPAAVVSRLDLPILVIQGTTDLQVGLQDAKLLNEAAKSSHLIEIEGMNHILKQARGNREAQTRSYISPDFPLHPNLINPIVEFIKQSSTD